MIKRGVLTLCGTLVVAGCGGGSQPTDAGKPSAASSAPGGAKQARASAEQTVGMVSAVGIVKSTVPVALKFGLRGPPKIGEPLNIDLAVVPQVAADSAVVQVLGSDGLDTSAAGDSAPIDKLESGSSYKRSIAVTPTKPGVLLLGINVNLKHDEITESRAFTIPIIVAEAPSK